MTLTRDINKLVDTDRQRTGLPDPAGGTAIGSSVGIALIKAGREADDDHMLTPPLRLLISETTVKTLTSTDGSVSFSVEDAAGGTLIDATGAEYAFTVEWP